MAAREIKAAERLINEQLDLIDDIRRTEGVREARKSAGWGDVPLRMSRHIATLRRARHPMPARLVANWSHFRVLGWHNELTLPMN